MAGDVADIVSAIIKWLTSKLGIDKILNSSIEFLIGRLHFFQNSFAALVVVHKVLVTVLFADIMFYAKFIKDLGCLDPHGDLDFFNKFQGIRLGITTFTIHAV